jgi:hypothetical protein
LTPRQNRCEIGAASNWPCLHLPPGTSASEALIEEIYQADNLSLGPSVSQKSGHQSINNLTLHLESAYACAKASRCGTSAQDRFVSDRSVYDLEYEYPFEVVAVTHLPHDHDRSVGSE